jgi:hypothetical protein
VLEQSHFNSLPGAKAHLSHCEIRTYKGRDSGVAIKEQARLPACLAHFGTYFHLQNVYDRVCI